MIYEHRVYNCVPGALPRLLKRFEDHALKLWQKHGIRQVGFWRVMIGDDNQSLHYMIAWDSLADRETRWGAFMADPEWHAARSASEADGPILAGITSTMLQPTAFSALK